MYQHPQRQQVPQQSGPPQGWPQPPQQGYGQAPPGQQQQQWGPPQQQWYPPQQQQWGPPPPQFQQIPEKPPKKKSLGKRLGVLVVLIVLIIVVISIVATKSGANTGTATNGNATGTVSTDQHFRVGQQITVSNWLITLNSAKTSAGSQFLQPKAGDVYLIFTISMKNTSNQAQTVSTLLQFTLQDASGQKYDETIYPDAGTTLDGTVRANSPLKGVIVYEVPKNLHSFTLAFTADITASGQTVWDVSV